MIEDKQFLIDLAKMKMPYGKYKGRYLIDLPEHYLIWYKNKGFPNGKIGKQLESVYEIQLNGLEDIVRQVRKRY
ncbi:DUF3820 family protein [Flavobacteriaceae bacterium]|jgi:uncharacterized protein (DUF3820 family)|nr:DUF3820 family protein [Flavobacteriaceae bacterium]MDB0069624.1 DUF3820 family protein [Flavobacteriaceae bacterium]MDB3901203.1 DUF3820 family protein [Flavobacteriaceae bacterium]MDB4093792.1 DUF3820 family protein [Flavobacteriaceae bacterium]MDB9849192.1 DUF3820 family protein [Flavobacteriaceae bacterium]|tara:strand:- start:584 stop:805 length:222 start_codon:yes stop_codon:yes gene_type:complete